MVRKKSISNKVTASSAKPKRVHRDFQEFLLEHLQDPNKAAAYLKEALADEDKRLFLTALRDVLEAQGSSIAALSEETNLNKQNLYRMLSKGGNPRLMSLIPVLHAIGFEIDINPIKRSPTEIKPVHTSLKR